MEEKGLLFPAEEFLLMNVGGMMELENHHLPSTTVIITEG